MLLVQFSILKEGGWAGEMVQQMKCKLEEVDSDSQSPQKSWEETSLGGLREGQREVVLRDPAANHSGML